MHSWNQGYVTDISYTKGYYSTLNPLRISLCFLAQRLMPPKIRNACELGFGQGITLNFNATNPSVSWYGTDFNPSQASFAHHLCEISNTSLKVFDDSFEDFIKRDIPQFDFIALHGIYSWVSPKVRGQIREFISKKLRYGGVVMLSYNTQAGWASISPLRELIRAYSIYLTPTGKPSSTRTREGLEFVEELMRLPSTETIKNPQIISMLQTLNKMDDTYLAHELLNENQVAFNFLEISKEMEEAKLEFGTYAGFGDHLSNIQLSDQERGILSRVSHSRPIYEMLKDLMFATSFRSDYWVRGSIPLSISQCQEELLKLRIVLTIPYSQINYTLNTRRGVLNLNQDFYAPIFELLKDNHPIEVREIKSHLDQKLKREVAYNELIESLIALSSKDCIKLACDDEVAKASKPYTQRLNAHILEQALQTPDYIRHIVSPLTGEGIALNRFELLFLYAYLNKEKKEWSEYVYELLSSRKENIIKDGKELNEAQTKEELKMQEEKIKEWIPVFQKLGIL